MKISGFEATTLNVPEDEPLANMPEETDRTRPVVILQLRTDDGLEGLGVTFYGGRMTGNLRVAVEELAGLTVGEDPMRIEAIIAKLRGAAESSGPGGIFTLALAAIDVALWDIKGKALEQPLWKLLGGHRDRVPTYASGALRRGLTDDQAAQAARTLVEKGFTEMKTQMALPGNPAPADEIRRVRTVREAIGPDIKLMCDINQRWRPEQAIDIGSRVEDVGLFWLEDVTTADDYQGLARVTAALNTPIAGGEYLWGSAESLCGFVESTVAPGSLIVTDDWSGYAGLGKRGYEHFAVAECGDPEVAEQYLPIIHLVFANLKTWLIGIHHGVSHQHLQAYLNEFTFRFNRRFYPFNAFRSLLGIAGDTSAPTYAELYSGEWRHPTCSGHGR